MPKFSNNFQLKIEQLVKSSHQKLQQSKSLYQQAEKLLLQELDLLNFQPSSDNVAIKSFKQIFGKSG